MKRKMRNLVYYHTNYCLHLKSLKVLNYLIQCFLESSSNTFTNS